MPELALQRIREAKEKRLTRLDLGNCGLTELPEELFELDWLEELILSSNWMEYDLENEKSTFLSSENKYLKKRENSITKLNSNIKNLKNLKKLVIAKYINHSSKLCDLTPLNTLSSLKELYLNKASIQDLSSLKNLTNLEALDLSQTKVIDINPLKNLLKLKYLNLTYTHIKDLTSLSNLNKLQLVGLSSTNISNLMPLASIIKKGIHVNLMNKLGAESIGIYVNNCPLATPPIEIINQGHNAVVRYFNQINEIQLELIVIEDDEFQLPKGHQYKVVYESDFDLISYNSNEIILFDTNGNNFIYENILEKLNLNSDNFLYKYLPKKNLFIIQKKTVDLYEAKLIIVGEGSTGKTTLFEKLKDNNHQIGNTPETHGINIHEGLPFKHAHIGDNTFHANLWDFGGQELQYMTHQFFLTPRALYVLMMDARRESPNLAYWFKIISLLGRDREDSIEKVRLLLVFNKRGNTTGTPPQYQDQLTYYADSLDVQYLEVDFAENDYRFDNLQNAIQQALVTLPIVKSQLPRLWKVVREDLREEAKTECYISTKRFSEICSKHGITEEADQWLLSGYLHQLGSLLHFQNDKGLRRLVILSPQWAVDGVYTFLSEESIARNNGRFTEDEFMALLATKGYNRDDADVILQLMTKNNFDICYEATERHYVAAQLLPDNAPLSIKWFPKEVLQFRYQYPIMPKGLMSRLIVRLSDDIERDAASGEQIVWKKGVVLHIKLKEGECRVRLREDDAESKAGLRQILIDVMGERDARKYALRKVRDTVDDLHKKWFRSIKADEMVPCCCSECVVSDTPQLYKLENLLNLKEKRPNAVCYSSGDDVPVQQLLEGVYDKVEIRDMENQGKY